MIKALIVEDSPVVSELLAHILSSDPDILVTGSAVNGEEAVEAVRRNKPDVVTMDIHMPKLDGFKATRIIMETDPVPIIIVTGSANMREVETSFRAIEAGAVTVVQKPRGIGHPDFEKHSRELIKAVKLMSEVKVVKRWSKVTEERLRLRKETVLRAPTPEIGVVAIGASTGGPPVIRKILSELPVNFPAPVLIVQHMAAGFIEGFAEWLGQTSLLPVHVAAHDCVILPGHVYVAPAGQQMKAQTNGRLSCMAENPENGLCPSVACLFRSVAEVYGKNAAGVLLTGMGKDGAEELKMMKEIGAVTIAQDEESSVVFGMSGEAIKLGAAMYVLPPERIAATLAILVKRN